LEASVNSTEVVTIAVAVLVPVVTTILGALGLAFQDWRERRSEVGRRKQAFEDAGRQVAFAAEWWNARKLLVDSPEAVKEATTRAVGWLEEASALVAKSKQVAVEEKPTITMRRLLLVYPLKGRAANVFRVVFYLCLAFWVGQVGQTITDALLHPGYVHSDALKLIALTLLVLGFRLLVGIAEEGGPEHEEVRRVTVRRWLLFYRFHRRAANIVRITFYLFVVGIATGAAFFLTDALGHPGEIPANVSALITWTGLAVGLRYWAASLEMPRENGTASPRGSRR
jgi:hypothetical protein